MSNWGDRPTPEDAPKFLTEEQKAQVKATNRGWELPLAGTDPEKGLTEVIVALGGIIENASEDGLVDGFDDFNEDEWTIPGVSGTRAPAIFDTVEFQNNNVLRMGVLASDYDTNNPGDYTKQRERMRIHIEQDVAVPATISAKIYIHKDWRDASLQLNRWLGIVALVRNPSNAPVTAPTLGVWVNEGVPTAWGPDFPEDYIDDKTPLFNEGKNPKLANNKWANLVMHVNEGSIDYIINGVHIATEVQSGIVTGSKISELHVATHNYNEDVDNYYIDDVVVLPKE